MLPCSPPSPSLPCCLSPPLPATAGTLSSPLLARWHGGTFSLCLYRSHNYKLSRITVGGQRTPTVKPLLRNGLPTRPPPPLPPHPKGSPLLSLLMNICNIYIFSFPCCCEKIFSGPWQLLINEPDRFLLTFTVPSQFCIILAISLLVSQTPFGPKGAIAF